MTAAPILEAVDNYRGTIVDLDAEQVIEPARFAAGWRGLARRMAECGLSPGDRVIVAVANGPLFIAAWAAILSEEGSPLLVHVDTPPAELARDRRALPRALRRHRRPAGVRPGSGRHPGHGVRRRRLGAGRVG